MNKVPHPNNVSPFVSHKQRLDNLTALVSESEFLTIEEAHKLFQFATTIVLATKKKTKRQNRSRKGVIMYENDIAGQIKRDASHKFFGKEKYTKKSRRLFNQGLSIWSLTIYEDVL